MSFIKGIQKTTLVDYPGKVAATIFAAGCNFRCPFCHNSTLVIEDKKNNLPDIPAEEMLAYLARRTHQLDGVCITGGEPTIHQNLPEFIKKIKELGYQVKLDTNGTNPQMLKELLVANLLDYIAMDIKGPLESYAQIVGVDVDVEKIRASITLIINSGVKHEFRTTVLPVFHNSENIKSMGCLARGADAFYLQQYRSSEGVLDSNFQNESAYTADELELLTRTLAPYVTKVAVRGAA